MILRVRIATLVTLVGLLTMVGGIPVTTAAAPAYDLSSSYDVQADKRIQVQQTFTTSVTSAEAPLTSVNVPVIGKDMKSLTGRLLDGTALTTTGNESQHVVQVDFGNVTKKSRKWSFVVSYNAAVDSNFGKIEGFFFPPTIVPNIDVGKHSISISYDTSLGLASITSPKPATEKLTAGKETMTFESTKGAFSKTIGLHFGDSTVAEVALSQELNNSSWWWKSMTVVLPPDTNQQQVMIDSLTPRPSSIRLDEDGNIIAQYRLRPRQKLKLSGKVTVRMSAPVYALDGNTATVADFPELVRSRYTKLGVGVLANDTPVLTSLRDQYDKSLASSSKDKARELVTVLQQKGLAARLVRGVQFASSSSMVLHDWAEVYVPKAGWVTLDPDNSLDFAAADYSRLAGRIGEGDFVIGKGAIHFEPLSDLPKVDETPQLTSTNHMILPGVALNVVSVGMPKGLSTDDNALKQASGNIVELGSLAPLQSISTKRFLIGSKAFASEEVKFGTLADEQEITELVASSSRTSYLYMAGGLGVFILLIILRTVRLVLRRRASKRHVPTAVETPLPSLESMPELAAELAPSTQQPLPASPSMPQTATVIKPHQAIGVRPRMAYRDPLGQQRRKPPTLIQ